MIDAISGALTGLRAAVDMAKAAIDTRDAIKIGEAKAALIERLLDVQTACLSLQERNATLAQDKHTLAQEKRDLEAQIAQLQQQADKLARYERTRTPVGAIVFVESTSKDSPDGPVYACASCADDGKISTLQPTQNQSFLVCATHGKFGYRTHPGPQGGVGMLARMD